MRYARVLLAAWIGLAAVVLFGAACGNGEVSDELPPGPLRWADRGPSWSPDGRSIVFARAEAEVFDAALSLWIVNVSSGIERRLTRGERHSSDVGATWSPDGREIAFERQRHSSCGLLHLIDSNGRGLRSLRRIGCGPAWSPDGSRLASLSESSRDLMIVNRRGRVLARVTGGDSIHGFDWSPSGSRLVLERDNEIWTVHADGRGLRRLTRSGYSRVAHGPVWSPDGSLILHDRLYPKGGAGLWTMRPDGSHARKVAEGEIYDRSWSPDGRQIAYENEHGSFVADRDGDNRRRLPSIGGAWSWSPDSRRFAAGGTGGGIGGPEAFPIVLIDVSSGDVTRATQRP